MGTLMDDEIKRWTARRKSALVRKSSKARRRLLKPAELTTCHPQRSRSGLRMASAGWRTHYPPILRTYANSTRSS